MTASPNNTEATAVSLGSLVHAGDSFTATGNNTTGTSAWYAFTVPSTTFISLMRVTVAGGSGDEATLFWDVDGRTLAGPSTDFTEAAMGGNVTLYAQVTGGTAGSAFVLTVSVIAGPPAVTDLGTLTVAGDALTASDSNTYGTAKWYSVTVPSYVSPVEISITGDSAYDEATLYSGSSITGPGTDMNEAIAAGTAYIVVAGGTSADSFTLTVTPPAS